MINRRKEELTEEHNAEMRLAKQTLNNCPRCDGKPHLTYSPGCTYSYCVHQRVDCPCMHAVPDFDPDWLAREINRNIERDKG